jgi:hypothetical protein
LGYSENQDGTTATSARVNAREQFTHVGCAGAVFCADAKRVKDLLLQMVCPGDDYADIEHLHVE